MPNKFEPFWVMLTLNIPDWLLSRSRLMKPKTTSLVAGLPLAIWYFATAKTLPPPYVGSRHHRLLPRHAVPCAPDLGIDGIQLIEAEVGVVPDRAHRVVLLEVRNELTEVQLIAIEAVGERNTEFLSVEEHRRTVDRRAAPVPDQRLERIDVVL